jgi:hypothetical protein
MHIRFESAFAGQRFSYSPGDVADWPDEDEAKRLVDKGIAEQLTPEAAKEAASSVGRPVRRHKQPERMTQRPAGEKAVTV